MTKQYPIQTNENVAEVLVTWEEYLKWLKKQEKMDVTKTEYGVICDAKVGEKNG